MEKLVKYILIILYLNAYDKVTDPTLDQLVPLLFSTIAIFTYRFKTIN